MGLRRRLGRSFDPGTAVGDLKHGDAVQGAGIRHADPADRDVARRALGHPGTQAAGALYRASSSQKTVAGIPLVQIAGVGCIATAVFLYYEFLHESALGIVKRSEFFMWAGGTILAGVIFYYVARAVRKSQGVDIDRAFAEIPPE